MKEKKVWAALALFRGAGTGRVRAPWLRGVVTMAILSANGIPVLVPRFRRGQLLILRLMPR